MWFTHGTSSTHNITYICSQLGLVHPRANLEYTQMHFYNYVIVFKDMHIDTGNTHTFVSVEFSRSYFFWQKVKMCICPVSWGCKIHWLHLCRGVRLPPPTSVLDMTLNSLMGRFQQCWSFGECGVPLHCHRFQVHSGSAW